MTSLRRPAGLGVQPGGASSPWGSPGQVNSLSSSLTGHPNSTNLTWVCGEQKRVQEAKCLSKCSLPLQSLALASSPLWVTSETKYVVFASSSLHKTKENCSWNGKPLGTSSATGEGGSDPSGPFWLSRSQPVLGLRTHLQEALPHLPSLLPPLPLFLRCPKHLPKRPALRKAEAGASLTFLANFTIPPNTTSLPWGSQPQAVTNSDNCEMEGEDGRGQSWKLKWEVETTKKLNK